MEFEKIILFLVLLVSLTVHEWAHAFTADKLGDPLPRKQGRVTLDPRSHMDLIGTIILPIIIIFVSPSFAIFGWGKPVQISLPNKDKRKRDDILITLAGPFSNFAICLITVIFFSLWVSFSDISHSFYSVFFIIVNLNCTLLIFNLIPIPPLDGSHILKNAINMRPATYQYFSRYGFFILLVLINIPAFQSIIGDSIIILSGAFFSIFSQIIN
ncbi:MAG: site-2 protease family protein [Opitutae bacterium]|jgi:Zn-dependent protease|nr:site-2 protease family protein [Opitutae bacterium]MBT5716660.1 site-2 protease family protein [Opitutae bacterium]